ncbi:helix-turn-helix domain-containing protein [Arcticibacter sp. MXS-1]|uniref:helix-turn-helix domain-containing protein n=1 Tax=Arcticibacter sp. MXS-1 TaxID=3341726 RepID=UPI0035A82BD9
MEISVQETAQDGYMIILENHSSSTDLQVSRNTGESLDLHTFSFEGITVIVIEARQADIQILNRSTDRHVTLYSVFEGTLKSENASGEITYLQAAGGQHGLYYPLSLIRNLHSHGPLQAFMIVLPESYLSRLLRPDEATGRYLGLHLSRQKPFISAPLPASPSTYHHISSILSGNLKSGIKRLLLEARILELLSSQLEQMDQHHVQRPATSFLRGRDVDRIYEAKAFIEENLRTPCSLIELSRKVGLNDFKLKKGFREVLGTTVFNYLSDYRMERAKTLLEQKRSVSEVAHEVGYKNPHHFTAAFKKKYGILPSSFNKGRS